MSAIRVPLSEPGYTSAESAHSQPQIVFTRQLWERTMPATDTSDTSTGSHSVSIGRDRSRKLSSVVPLPSYSHSHSRPSPTHSRVSDTPLTPEESPPFRSSRKRSADTLDQDEAFDISPSHTRDNSGDSSISFCLCQPEPKVPRPRNAFILYRQSHQAVVVAQNPGLANPDISKIIGEQWRNEPEEEKNKWKAYAEEEKLQHQQRYPLYRYQPKRSGRRTSVSSDSGPLSAELRKCAKCGGRSITHPTPSTPSSGKDKLDKSNSTETSPTRTYALPTRHTVFQLPPPTPSSTTTPSTRYLPMLNNLSLSSPHARSMAQGRPHQPFVPMPRTEENRASPLDPDTKRRRFESPQGTYVMSTRPMPGRQNGDPATPFPFHPQQQHSQPNHQALNVSQPYPQGFARRESLPPAVDILHGPANNTGLPPSMMGPPPRPTPGYSQHRMSQGHVRPPGGELSLTLPPLHTVGVIQGPPTSGRAMSGYTNASDNGREGDKRSLSEKIMSITFQHKISILRRIMPPLPVSPQKGRATIIAIEGDDAEAARNLTDWLQECLGRQNDMIVKVVDGPRPSNVAEYPELHVEELFKTVIDWHAKNKEIVELARQDNGSRKDSASLLPDKEKRGLGEHVLSSTEVDHSLMDIDEHSSGHGWDSSKVVILFRTYTLTASNVYASGIPITDVYRPDDHWQWTATLWRGIVGPDLTIYVKDSEGSGGSSNNSASLRGNSSEGAKGGVEIVEEPKMNYKFMAVRRTRGSSSSSEGGRHEMSGCEGVEAGTLRRLGFEVGEWIRSAGFGTPRAVEGGGS